jgi:hypothetical protein
MGHSIVAIDVLACHDAAGARAAARHPHAICSAVKLM